MPDINLTISIITLNVNGIIDGKKADSLAPVFDLAAHYKISKLASKNKLIVLRARSLFCFTLTFTDFIQKSSSNDLSADFLPSEF